MKTYQSPNFVGYLFLCFFSVTLVFFVYLMMGIKPDTRHSLWKMMDGSADRPFVYRVLLPGSLHILSELLPDSVEDSLTKTIAEFDLTSGLLNYQMIPPQHGLWHFFALIINYGLLLAFIFVFRALIRELYQMPHALVDLVPLLAVLGIMPFLIYNYMYDFLVLVLFPLGLLYILGQEWGNYLIVFTLGCLNKETTIFLTLVYVLYSFHLGKVDWHLVISQGLIFGFIKGGLSLVFRDNPGSVVEYHFPEHLERYQAIFQDAPMVGIFCMTIFLGVIPFLVWYKWIEKPAFLWYAASPTLPLFIMYLLWGVPFEIRVFYEVYPAIFLLCIHGLYAIVNTELPVHDPLRKEVA